MSNKRIKTFCFEVSNCSCCDITKSIAVSAKAFDAAKERISTPEMIDNEVNGFISSLPEGTEVLGIETSSIVTHSTNNQCDDIVKLYYTLYYELPEGRGKEYGECTGLFD